MASAAVLVGSAASTGGLAALVVRILGNKKGQKGESKKKEQGS
jgi:hypothetical protein